MINNLLNFYITLISKLDSTVFTLDGYTVSLWQIVFIPLALEIAIGIVISLARR